MELKEAYMSTQKIGPAVDADGHIFEPADFVAEVH